jgi:hypothetical protein
MTLLLYNSSGIITILNLLLNFHLKPIKTTGILGKRWKYQKIYIFKKKDKTMKKTLFQYKEKIKLDKKDKRILYELYKNARTPINNIAKQVNLSKDTIKYRIKRLEKIGLILAYSKLVH